MLFPEHFKYSEVRKLIHSSGASVSCMGRCALHNWVGLGVSASGVCIVSRINNTNEKSRYNNIAKYE